MTSKIVYILIVVLFPAIVSASACVELLEGDRKKPYVEDFLVSDNNSVLTLERWYFDELMSDFELMIFETLDLIKVKTMNVPVIFENSSSMIGHPNPEVNSAFVSLFYYIEKLTRRLVVEPDKKYFLKNIGLIMSYRDFLREWSRPGVGGSEYFVAEIAGNLAFIGSNREKNSVVFKSRFLEIVKTRFQTEEKKIISKLYEHEYLQ